MTIEMVNNQPSIPVGCPISKVMCDGPCLKISLTRAAKVKAHKTVLR